MHGEYLRDTGVDDATVSAIQTGEPPARDAAPVQSPERLLLAFAAKLNDTPRAVQEHDVAALREAGFTDENILDTVMVVALMNFHNRWALGLGLAPDAEHAERRREAEARLRAAAPRGPQ